MATTSSAAAPRKRRVGRIIGIILAVLIIPLVIGYFVATSETFFKKVILPKAGASMNATITVSDAAIHPFSGVALKNLEVKPFNKETLLKAAEVRAHYSLWDIIRGKITVNEATLVSPVITIVEASDGSSNLDPITKQSEPSAKEEKKEKTSKPANLNIHNVALKDATVLQTKNLQGGGRETTEISNLNLSIDQLVNGLAGKLTMAANVRMENVPTANSTNAAPGSMRGTLVGNFDYKLTADAQPESAKGNLRFDVAEAKGQMADLAKLAAIVDCDLTPTEIRQLALHFEQNGNALGQIRASGPFSAANMEGKLNLVVSSIDRRVLNLAGAASGIDFNSTVISSQNEIVLSQKGNAISVNGHLNADKLSLTKKAEKQTTPTLDFKAAYQISVDQNAKSALVEKFDLNGTQNQQKILTASLSKPMAVSWGGASSAPENAALKLAVTDLNLADWKAFAGDLAPSGKLNANLDLVSQQAGKQLALNVASRISDFSAKFGSNQVSNADVELKAKADIAEMKKVSLQSYFARLSQNNQPALTLSGSGTLGLKDNSADIKAVLQGSLALLFKIVVVPDLTATSGTVKFDGQITQAKDAKTVKGNFSLADLSGSYAGSPLDRFGAAFDLNLAMTGDNLQINKASGALQQAGKKGGNLDATGNYNSAAKTGNIELKIADVNQNALRPFLAKSLGEKQLVTISLNGNATAFLQKDISNVKANFDVQNLIVRDPKKPQAAEPLSAQLQMDGTQRNEIFDLKQFQVKLSPTQRAQNVLNITGQLDLSKTNAANGQLIVQSESFDVTPFYDLYAAPEKPAAQTPGSTPPAEETKPNEEPEAIKLPVERILAEVKIKQFFLREIEIKDWQGTAKIEGSRVLLNPFQLSLNGAPVSVNADLNLGVKGYAFDFSASLDKVPLEPLANSFMPEKRGAYKGTIIANAKIKGAGTTGVNLKKTLTGQAAFTFTNANIQVVGKRLKPFLTTVALVLQAPELTASPVEWVSSNLKFGDGKIDLQNFQMQSDAFTADTKGIIPIADVLTNSPIRKFPVNFGLSYSLAKKARLTSSSTPTNSAYVMLPGFLFVKGTLGDPKPDYDKTKLLGTVLEKLGGKIPGVDEKTGNLIQGLGGILGGKPAQNPTNQTETTNQLNTTNNPAATNDATAPQTNSNQQLIDGVLDLFNKKKRK